MPAPIPRDISGRHALPSPLALKPFVVPATAVVTPVRRPAAAVFRLLVALAAAGGVTPDRYLYPLLDVGQDGFKRVLGNALLLGLAVYALAVLLVALDHARPNPIRHRGKTGFRL